MYIVKNKCLFYVITMVKIALPESVSINVV